ncbi:MAG: hypothetical protein EA398_07040 [Deltaproteobacteria bacterium]|nr:MAG: hypothetical protein EA398_07040 [Deltaproteobacteria bacterium]
MRRSTTLSPPGLLAPFVAALAGLWLVAAPAAAEERIEAPYRGEVIDQDHVPISGVFRLTFRLHADADARTPVWEETHWVAVHEGMYDVLLGSVSPLPAERLAAPLWISVLLGSTGEITRHPADLRPRQPVVDEARMAEIERLRFADVAERALFAEEAARAEDCRTLDGRTAQELDRYEELDGRIRELSRQRSDAPAAGAVRVGRTTQTLPSIGGRGGQPYDRACPPNHVVTGARGRSGQLIDSMELICSPLQ